jgi:hypothetical protein
MGSPEPVPRSHAAIPVKRSHAAPNWFRVFRLSLERNDRVVAMAIQRSRAAARIQRVWHKERFTHGGTVSIPRRVRRVDATFQRIVIWTTLQRLDAIFR